MIHFETESEARPMGQIWKFAVPFAAIALAGCMPETPRTAFDWGVNDRAPRHVASVAKTYTYQEKNARPAARPADANRVASSAAITSQALPPVSGGPLFFL